MLAATWGHAGWCAQLLTHQPQQQVQAVSKGGYTALELACEHDHVQCIKVLLANKAPLLSLFIEFSVAAKLSTILQDMAQTVLAPDRPTCCTRPFWLRSRDPGSRGCMLHLARVTRRQLDGVLWVTGDRVPCQQARA